MNIKGKSANKHSHAGTTVVPFPGFSWEQPVAGTYHNSTEGRNPIPPVIQALVISCYQTLTFLGHNNSTSAFGCKKHKSKNRVVYF